MFLEISHSYLFHLDLDVHAGWQGQRLQRFNSLECRLCQVDQAAVRAHLVLVARVLVNECGLVHRELADACRQRNRTVHDGAGPLGCIDDLSRGFIQYAMVKGAQADADTGNTAIS